MTNRLTPLHLEVKRALGTDGTFTGYASTFGGPPDSFGDIIARGAFRDALDAHKRAGTTPAMLWSHDQSEPIGKWLELEEDGHGLKVTGKLTLATTRGAEAYALLQDNALAMSIGFQVAPNGARESKGIREITRIGRLAEISLVSMPANARAVVTAVKAKPASPREYERFLREVGGYSHREAKTLTTSGWRGNARDERETLDLILDRVEYNNRLLEELKHG